LVVLIDYTTTQRFSIACTMADEIKMDETAVAEETGTMADEIEKEETGVEEETGVVEEPVEKKTWKEMILGPPDKYNYL
jgi:5,10-methenyltetrahydromethanopterin hydrogenase